MRHSDCEEEDDCLDNDEEVRDDCLDDDEEVGDHCLDDDGEEGDVGGSGSDGEGMSVEENRPHRDQSQRRYLNEENHQLECVCVSERQRE